MDFLQACDDEPIEPWGENRHKKGQNVYRQFISCDTETHAVDDKGTQRPMLFGFSSGDYITGYSLHSNDMLDLCILVAQRNKDAIFVGFFFDFDVNFIVKDLPVNKLRALFKGDRNACHWNGFRIQYLKGKFFRVSRGRIEGDSAGKNRTKWEHSITIYCAESWFEKGSLIAAARKHLPRDPEIEFVETGKRGRNAFRYDELQNVLEYWEAEQRLFVRLMDKIRANILAANLPLPRDWWGPSALSQATLKAHKVHEHLQHDLPEEYYDAAQYAYFGGRFEQFQAGYHDGPVYQYDIVSAYPNAMQHLWSWQDSRLEKITANQIDRSKPFPAKWRYSVWKIHYKYNAPNMLRVPHPLPMRFKTGAVFFPPETTGWYWSPEAAIVWNMPEAEFLEGYVVHSGGLRPFDFIPEMFEQRRELKRQGDSAQYAIKITMNAAYGKVAQRAGAKKDREGKWRLPSLHQLDWAGYITSHARRKLFYAMARAGFENVVSVETDAVFSKVPIPELETGSGDLGTWDLAEYTGMIGIQSGIYWMRDFDGEWSKGRVRGIAKGPKSITAEEALDFLTKYVEQEQPKLTGCMKMFHGYSHAMFNKAKLFVFEEVDREITFGGTGKRFHDPSGHLDPSKSLVGLTNGAMLLVMSNQKMESHPHYLPWRKIGEPKETDIARNEEDEVIFCDWENIA